MKLAQLFFQNPILTELGLAMNEPMRYGERKDNSSCIFYTFPPQAEIVPYISIDPLAGGKIHFNTGLWFGGQQMYNQLAESGYLGMADEVHPGYENVFKLLARDFKRVLEEFEHPKVPLRRLVEIYLNYPDVFYQYVVVRNPPDPKLKDDILICLTWELWNQRGLPLEERLTQMRESGAGKSLRDTKHLSTNAARLGLPPARYMRQHSKVRKTLLHDSREASGTD